MSTITGKGSTPFDAPLHQPVDLEITTAESEESGSEVEEVEEEEDVTPPPKKSKPKHVKQKELERLLSTTGTTDPSGRVFDNC